MVTDCVPRARPIRSARRVLWAPVLTAAALALAGCAPAPQEAATMMRGAGYGPGAMLDAAPPAANRQVEILDVTPQTVMALGLFASDLGAQRWTYRLGVGDVMQIFAVDAPELTLEAGYRVEVDGAIQVPFLGRVPVAERSADEVRADLAQRLRQYLSAPQVDVRITGFNARHVAIVGEVARPSRQTLTDRPLTVIDAINAAGGFGGDPSRASVTLIRDGVESAVDVQGFLTHGAPTPVLRDNDVVRVGGAAARTTARPPGARAHSHDAAGRVQAIALDGGPVSVAQVAMTLGLQPGGAVLLLRDGADRIRAYRLGAGDAVSADLGARIMLRPGDMLADDPMPSVDPIQQVAHLTPALRAMNRE